MRPNAIILATVLFATAPTASAQLYKWVDEGGVVNYGDWPPAGVKVQPVNHGTLSSVSDRALVAPVAIVPEASRTTPRAAGSSTRARSEAQPSTAPVSPGEAEAVSTNAPYYDYARRPVVAETERRPANGPIARPMLPIDPAIPDMPLRPRR